jgi:hypothetical protein
MLIDNLGWQWYTGRRARSLAAAPVSLALNHPDGPKLLLRVSRDESCIGCVWFSVHKKKGAAEDVSLERLQLQSRKKSRQLEELLSSM